MNYIKSLRDFLINDPEISAIVGDRVAFLKRNDDWERPFIIFTEGAQVNNHQGFF